MKKENIYKFLYTISIILIVVFVVTLGVDYSRYYMYAAPYYIYIIARAVEFVIPSIIMFIVAKIVKKKYSKAV